MCLLAIQYRLVPESPILVAANREEFCDRVATQPSIQPGKPRILGGIDQQSGGTWLGVNQHGLFVGVCNRNKVFAPIAPRSRGALCRDLLRSGSARRLEYGPELESAGQGRAQGHSGSLRRISRHSSAAHAPSAGSRALGAAPHADRLPHHAGARRTLLAAGRGARSRSSTVLTIVRAVM